MKSFLFVVVFAVVSATSVAFAQQVPGIGRSSLNIPDPRPREEVIHLIAENMNTAIDVDEPVPGDFAGNLPNMTVKEMLRAVLPTNFESVVDPEDFVIHVRKRQQRVVRHEPVREAEPLSAIDRMLGSIPPPIEVVPVNAPQPYWDPRQANILSSIGMPAPSSYVGDNGWGGRGYYASNGSYIDYDYVQRSKDLDSWAGLKFKKGDESVMENIEVRCHNGSRVKQADESNNIWDSRALVPAGCSPLIYRYNDGKVDWEVEVDEVLPPLRIQGHKEITLTKAYFENARRRTEYLRYSMVEQPDGSFKRVPR